MKLKEDNSYNKLHGIYYTPDAMAHILCEKFLTFTDNLNVLEPSCGDGVFVRETTDRKFKQITCVEIEKNETDKLVLNYKNNDKVKVVNSDFFKFFRDNKEKYDLILGNPPYIRYQYLTGDQRNELSSILATQGMKENKLINAWVAFTIACSTMLTDNGTLAFVVPAELLQVAYANDLRKFLVKTFNSIDIVAFNELTFDEIEQEIILLICRKSSNNKGLRIIQTKNVDTLSVLDLESTKFFDFPTGNDKWTKFFTNNESLELFDKIKEDIRFQKISDVALINVGITTGNNDFFSIGKDINEKYNLSQFCKPLIGKSCQVHSVLFDQADLDTNYNNGKKTMLLTIDAQDKKFLPKSLVEYLDYGESIEANVGYKCRIRDYWYSVPSVWVPDAFFSRRNNFYPKFIFNGCKAVSTDTMHRIKMLNGANPKQIILSYYNSVSFAFSEICGRSYGGGVLEILPSECGNIMIPIIDNFDNKTINEHITKIDLMVRKGMPIERILDYGDKHILIDCLGFTLDECNSYRKIWKTLQKRRLSRK